MSKSTFPTICRVMRQTLDLDEEILLQRNTVLSDLEIGDSELADLRDALESEFGITIEDARIEKCRTVDSLDSLVRRLTTGDDDDEGDDEDECGD